MREAARDALVKLLAHPRYEVFPLRGIEDAVAEYVPGDLKLTITSSPTRGIDATLALSEELVRRGFELVPLVPPARTPSRQERDL